MRRGQADGVSRLGVGVVRPHRRGWASALAASSTSGINGLTVTGLSNTISWGMYIISLHVPRRHLRRRPDRRRPEPNSSAASGSARFSGWPCRFPGPRSPWPRGSILPDLGHPQLVWIDDPAAALHLAARLGRHRDHVYLVIAASTCGSSRGRPRSQSRCARWRSSRCRWRCWCTRSPPGSSDCSWRARSGTRRSWRRCSSPRRWCPASASLIVTAHVVDRTTDVGAGPERSSTTSAG